MRTKQLILSLFLCLNFTFYAQENSSLNNLQKADSLNRSANYLAALTYYNTISKNALLSNDYNTYVYVELQKTKIKSLLRKHHEALNDIIGLKKYFKKNKILNDSLWVSLTNTNSIILKNIGKFKEALYLNDQLIIHLKKHTAYKEEIYHTRSRLEIDLEQYDHAISSARKTISIYKAKKDSLNLAAIYNIIGVVYYFKQNSDSTLHYYLKSLAIKNRIKKDFAQLAISSYNIGIVYEDMANYKKAIDYYLDAVKYDLKDGGESIGFLIDIYGALVNTYGNMKDFDNAEKYANKLSVLIEKNNAEEYPYLSFSYIAYAGIKELQKDYITALIYVKKALKIREKTYGKNHKWTLECWRKLGHYNSKLKNYKKAKIYFEKALKIANKINEKEQIVTISKQLGDYFTAIKEYSNAQVAYTNAINNVTNTFFETKELLYELNFLKAKTYFYQEKFDVATNYINQLKTISINNSLLQLNYVRLLDLENSILNKSSKPNVIFKNLNTILIYLSKVKNQYATANSKIYISNNFDDIINNAVNLCYDLYLKTKDSKFKIKALEFSEFNRNSTLLEGIQSIEIKHKIGVPKTVLTNENQLRKKIAQYKQEIFYLSDDKKNNYKKLDKLTSKQIVLSNRLDSLQLTLKKDYPAYYQLKNISNKFDLKKIQATIKANEVVIEYFFTTKNLFIFYIKNNSLTFYKKENSGKLKSQVLAFRKNLKNQNNTVGLTKSITNFVIPKPLDESKIKIIPDGILNFFPFECLSYKNSYFIENKNISYIGSLNLMLYQLDLNKNNKPKNLWVGFAPKYKNDQSLQYNISEVKNIQQLTNGKIFINENATKSIFLEHSNDTKIVHLATHTQLNNSNSLYNKLLFSNIDESTNSLTASEIYNLNFNANLVVLSSCNTGFGKIDTGEGVQNMSRAFTYAGIPNTVMSLWKVPDKETNLIMELFYTFLKKGDSKDVALKNAKLTYLKNTQDNLLKHPYFWAGFVLYGNNKPIELNNENPFYLKWIGVFFLLIGLLFILRTVRKNRIKKLL